MHYHTTTNKKLGHLQTCRGRAGIIVEPSTFEKVVAISVVEVDVVEVAQK